RDELYKGSMTFVNLDNDDNDSVFDNKDSKVSGGDDEMVRLDLRLQPPTLDDKNVKLTAISGGGDIRIWKSADKSKGQYNLGDPFKLVRKGNFLAGELWAEGIKAHTSQRQTVLRLKYPPIPDIRDEVALTVIGVESIEWKGRKNGYSRVPGTNIRDCTSDELDINNGSRRVFPGARQGDPVSRDKVDFDIKLTVKPPYDTKIYCRALDIDDPSSDPVIDPNDTFADPYSNSYYPGGPVYTLEGDNRNDIGGNKAGRITGEQNEGSLKIKEVSFNAGTDVVTNEFQTTMSPGDNFVIVANGDKDFVLKLRNRDQDDEDEVVNRDPITAVGGTGTEIQEPVNYASEILTMWRILHTERDSMLSPPPSPHSSEKNFVEGTVTRMISANGTSATIVRLDQNLEDGSKDLDDADSDNGRFEKGWISIGSDKVLTEVLMGNGDTFVRKDTGINIPVTVSKEGVSDVVSGEVTDFSGNEFTLYITPPSNLTANYIGGKINVAGVEMNIASISDDTVHVTALADIPFILHDDDVDSRLPHILTGAKMDDAFFDAYYLPTIDGGDKLANNQVGLDGVRFVRNLGNDYIYNIISKRDSVDKPPDNLWIIYVCSAWQYKNKEDDDPFREKVVLGVAPSTTGNDKVYTGGKTSWVFIESTYDCCNVSNFEMTYVHEVGHQLGLDHLHGNKKIMSYDSGKIAEFWNQH
ncbi:MAG: hypothetical protein GY751_09330, partial [Bacteroidetes bacterium]|nr:hypothetical protein [Bacteroidota bacterium]